MLSNAACCASAVVVLLAAAAGGAAGAPTGPTIPPACSSSATTAPPRVAHSASRTPTAVASPPIRPGRRRCSSGAATRAPRRVATTSASLYQHGDGIAADPARAAALHQHACDAGVAAACTNLGVLYTEGQGVAVDPASAAALFQRVAVTEATWPAVPTLAYSTPPVGAWASISSAPPGCSNARAPAVTGRDAQSSASFIRVATACRATSRRRAVRARLQQRRPHRVHEPRRVVVNGRGVALDSPAPRICTSACDA